MSQIEALSFPEINEIESFRQSKVIVLAASKLELSILPKLYESMLTVGPCKKLDIVIYGNGGEINATRRIALLLHEFCEQLTFIVPHHCQSAFTLLTLSGHQIITGDLALFSPIDPGLTSASALPAGSSDTIACEDVRLFCEMSEKWFGVSGQGAKNELLAGLMNSIFPTTLTTLYRSTQEQEVIATELLGLTQKCNDQHTQIVQQLMHGYHSHHYALSGKDLANMGLNIVRDQTTETLAWQIACKLESALGSRALQSIEEPLTDVIIVSGGRALARQKRPHVPSPLWLELNWNQKQ